MTPPDSTLAQIRVRSTNGDSTVSPATNSPVQVALDLSEASGTIELNIEGLDSSGALVSSQTRLITISPDGAEPSVVDIAVLESDIGGEVNFAVPSPFDSVELVINGPSGLYPFDFAIVEPMSGPTEGPLVSELIDLQMDQSAPSFTSATLSVGYDEASIQSNPEQDLRIYAFDEEDDSWKLGGVNQTVDTDANTVTATLEHFSCYGVFESQPEEGTEACEIADPLEIGLIGVSGSLITAGQFDLPQSVLIQPDLYGSSPVITQRYYTERLEDGRVVIRRASFNQTLAYELSSSQLSESTDCGPSCQSLRQVLSDDEIRSDYIEPGMKSQGIFDTGGTFADPTDSLRPSFIKQQLTLRCLLESQETTLASLSASDCFYAFTLSGQQERHFDDDGTLPLGLERPNHFFNYEDWRATDLNLLFSELLRTDGSFGYRAPPSIFYRAEDGENVTPTSVRDSQLAGRLAASVLKHWDDIEDLLGPRFSYGQLFALQNGSIAPDLADLIDAAAPRLSRFQNEDYEWNENFYDGDRLSIYTKRDFANQVIKLGAFDGDPVAAKAALTAMPLVTEDELGNRRQYATDVEQYGILDDARNEKGDTRRSLVDMREFSGFESNLYRLLEQALEAVPVDSDTQRAQHLGFVARLPETNTGVRNELITGYYREVGNAVQVWVNGEDPASSRPVIWANIAQWASSGVRAPIVDDVRGLLDAGIDFGDLVLFIEPEDVRQAIADGNQWIFEDAARHYARLIDFVDRYPNPTVEQWENYFSPSHDGTDGLTWQWSSFDRIAREGMMALVASRYAEDPEHQQALMFIHNASFGDVE